MKNHELLNMIGEVNEDYVLAAGDSVIKPRFRWGTLAACAACAALVLGAYPVYRAFNPPLHDYTVVEGGALSTEGELKVPAGGDIDVPGQGVPDPNPDQPPRGDGPSVLPGGAYVGGDSGEAGIDGAWYSTPGQDAPAQEEAAAQYQELLRGLGGQGGYEPESYPDWFAGAWIDNSHYPEARLTVAIVDSFRTPDLEARIEGWCGSGVEFESAAYSYQFLDGLMEPVTEALDGSGLACGIGVDVTENCLGVDLYGDGAAVPNSVLAKLARLDPAGDAIRVRVFTQTMSTLTDEVKKGPAPDRPAADPVPGGARAEPNEEPTSTPVVGDSEWTMPAEEPGEIDELPEKKYDERQEADTQLPEEYDIIEGE